MQFHLTKHASDRLMERFGVELSNPELVAIYQAMEGECADITEPGAYDFDVALRDGALKLVFRIDWPSGKVVTVFRTDSKRLNTKRIFRQQRYDPLYKQNSQDWRNRLVRKVK